jgi:flavin reductase (DIM6/NTAB) family NADH-FMN oxidoreductase RutF
MQFYFINQPSSNNRDEGVIRRGGGVVDSEEYRKAIRTFTTGVTVITVPKPGGMHGMTASSFASVSVEPRLVLISVAKVAHCHPHMLRTDRYGINLMLDSQSELANYFAGRRCETVPDFSYDWVDGCPVLTRSLGYFVCRKWAEYDGGDHTIFVGEVGNLWRSDDKPLVCSRGRYHELGTRTAGAQPFPEMITT